MHARCDSFVVETNVHFPTDNNLLYDAIRKSIQLTSNLCKEHKVAGWRQKYYNVRKVKAIITKINKIKRGKPRKKESILQKKHNVKKAYAKLIKVSESFIEKCNFSINELKNDFKLENGYFIEINKFINFSKTLIGQIKTRVFEEKKIPHEEKIFSVFEPYTEWICKGKAKAPFELGKRVAIVEDQYGFILTNQIMNKQTDDKITVPIIKKTKNTFNNLISCSFDKGFYSSDNKKELSKILNFVILPKKGKLSKNDKKTEYSDQFIKYRKKHSAIESAINALEVHGLDRCLDKGFYGFKRYIGIAIVSRNVQKIGALLKIKALNVNKRSKIKTAI